jgi:hypothetical protein
MRRTTRLAIALLLVPMAAGLSPAASALARKAVQTTPAPIFVFETDEFWLNLHHFLYVLGRAQGRMRDASAPSVAGAPGEAERGLAMLADSERRAWTESVAAYATGYSRRSLVFDEALAAVTRVLSEADDRPALVDGVAIEPAARTALERAAPIYRKVWWTAHRASNEAFRASLQALVDRHGRAVLGFITRSYGEQWPSAGFPVHLSAYVDSRGAYSTYGNLLVVSATRDPSEHKTIPLEIVFHEAMHQWDDAILAALQMRGLKLTPPGPQNLTHAMIWMTAGEAVRRVAPEHVPYAEAIGILKGRDVGPFRAALEETWRPYLNGRGTRDDGLKALISALASSPTAPSPETPSAAQPQPQAASPMFRIETDEFWLNLHHFLYVLGRAQSKAEDAAREAVANAPAEAERPLKSLGGAEQRAWLDAVTAYSAGLSQLDAIRGSPMPEITATLSQADDSATLESVSIDSAVRETLERAAPVYRKVWWPAHRASNQAWRTSIEKLVGQHGRTILDFITRAYAMPWPSAGFPVHASRYSNWAGGYSSVRGVLVLASSYPGNDGLRGLEGIFHEGMHQWDGQVYGLLGAQAKRSNATVPPDMPHALIWVTAGEAVRRSTQPTCALSTRWTSGSSTRPARARRCCGLRRRSRRHGCLTLLAAARATTRSGRSSLESTRGRKGDSG